MRGFWKNESGQSVVETAIALPILLLILCGIIDFSWLFLGQLSANNCAREGARFAITNATNVNLDTITYDKVLNIAPNNIKENISTTVTLSDPINPRNGDVTVGVNSIITTLTVVGDTFFNNNNPNIHSSVTMKAE